MGDTDPVGTMASPNTDQPQQNDAAARTRAQGIQDAFDTANGRSTTAGAFAPGMPYGAVNARTGYSSAPGDGWGDTTGYGTGTTTEPENPPEEQNAHE